MSTTSIETIRIGQIAIRFRLEGVATAGAVAMFEFDVPAGARVPIGPSHDAYDETLFGLTGTLAFTLEGTRYDVGPGDTLFIPRGAVHRFDNLSGVDATMLAVVTPGILGPDYFRDMADVIRAAAGGPPDPAALGAVMKKHGLTPAP